VGLATGVPVEYLVVGGDDFTQGLLDTITYLASAPSAPSVLTTSYGNDEDNFSLSDAQFVLAPKYIIALTVSHPQEHLRRIHGTRCSWHLGEDTLYRSSFSVLIFHQVIFSSGDGGVHGGHNSLNQCKNNTFIPTFPAACPYGMRGPSPFFTTPADPPQ
jgi:tripeptidyl-peptidase-1